ncbi:MAG: hypothetical protein ABJC10_02475 [Acidobacteriota bacterium]
MIESVGIEPEKTIGEFDDERNTFGVAIDSGEQALCLLRAKQTG